jgi:hypothetical protein
MAGYLCAGTSWVLGSAGCVYALASYASACPQHLNYKLKSVAHLPWRQMSQLLLNTIIDDLFAFVIKMPLLHRLSSETTRVFWSTSTRGGSTALT